MMKWRIVLEQDTETGDWAAWCPELPGCASSGMTEEEALDGIREAIDLYSARPDPIEDHEGLFRRSPLGGPYLQPLYLAR